MAILQGSTGMINGGGSGGGGGGSGGSSSSSIVDVSNTTALLKHLNLSPKLVRVQPPLVADA